MFMTKQNIYKNVDTWGENDLCSDGYSPKSDAMFARVLRSPTTCSGLKGHAGIVGKLETNWILIRA